MAKKKRKPCIPVTEKEANEMASLYKSGMVISKIARKFKRSTYAVYRALAAKGLAGAKKRESQKITEKIKEEMRRGGSTREIARRLNISCVTVLSRFRPNSHKECPETLAENISDFIIDEPGIWGILCDVHIPVHDRAALSAAVNYLKKIKPRGIILNGDTLDSHEISDHDKRASVVRYKEEITLCKEFLSWLRKSFPSARIVFKHGNHEERLERYLFQRAPAIAELPGIDIPSWCNFDDLGIENVTDRKKIMLGKLNLLHGHEYRGGGGVNPARWLYLKARGVAAMGHFHRTSSHHARNIDDKYEAAWSIGCLCDLKPFWLRYNDWDHGFAICEISRDLTFHFEQRRIIGDKVL